MKGRRGGRNDKACQLCYAEPSEREIAGSRLGARCYARVLAIAADAQVSLEREVQVTQAHGVICIECGTPLEVDEETLTLRCPNGHAVELIAAAPDPSSPRITAARPEAPSICTRCGQSIVREAGQTGRPKKFHDACRTPSELKRNRQKRDRARALAAKAGAR